MKNKILKLLNILYFVFIIYLILINFYKSNIYNIIGIIFSLLIFYIIKRTKINNKIFILLILLGLIVRIVPFFMNFNNILGDYSFNYYTSINFSKGLTIENKYISLFPYLYSYIFLLGNFMKLIGLKYISVIILNIIFDIIGFVYFYKLTDKYLNSNKKISILIYILNPFNILWNTIASPLVIVNTLFIMSIYYIYKLKETKEIKNIIILSIITGVIISIFNSFRPIAIILFIAIMLWIIIYSIKQLKILKQNYIKIIIVLLTFIITNILTNNFISNQINLEIPKTKSGWSIMLGSNYDNSGMWNSKDTELFVKMQKNSTAEEAQNKALKYGLKRYKTNGIKNVILFLKKSIILGNNFNIYSFTELNNQTTINDYFQKIIKIYLTIYLYFIFFSNLYISYKEKKYKEILPVPIYGLGLYLSTLLVEVSPRYFYPVLIALIIYSTKIKGSEI